MVRSLLWPILLFAATGCSAVVTGSPSEDTDAQSASVTGVVVVDRMLSSDDSARGEASARFVRVRGAIDDSALRLASASLDLPAIGECGRTSDPGSARAVELLDVGAITIESPISGLHVTLASRQVPDVVDLVSGTMYSARIDEATIPSGSDVAILVAGSADVPAFSVRARAPSAPDAVRLSGLEGPNAELTWNGNGGSDLVYVDVGSSRCAFTDDGHATLPASAFGDEGALVVHRVKREALTIPGLDSGELRFDFARTIAYRR